MKRNGDSTHPCRSPIPTVNGRDLTFPTWRQISGQECSDMTASNKRPSAHFVNVNVTLFEDFQKALLN